MRNTISGYLRGRPLRISTVSEQNKRGFFSALRLFLERAEAPYSHCITFEVRLYWNHFTKEWEMTVPPEWGFGPCRIKQQSVCMKK